VLMLFNSPKPLYHLSMLLGYVEKYVGQVTIVSSDVLVLLAGDFNSLDGSLHNSIVDKPTRSANTIDNIYVSQLVSDNVRVISLVVKSDDKAVIANSGSLSQDLNKRREQHVFRKCMPTQNGLFFENALQLNIEIKADADVQTNGNQMYGIMTSLLDQYYLKLEAIQRWLAICHV